MKVNIFKMQFFFEKKSMQNKRLQSLDFLFQVGLQSKLAKLFSFNRQGCHYLQNIFALRNMVLKIWCILFQKVAMTFPHIREYKFATNFIFGTGKMKNDNKNDKF